MTDPSQIENRNSIIMITFLLLVGFSMIISEFTVFSSLGYPLLLPQLAVLYIVTLVYWTSNRFRLQVSDYPATAGFMGVILSLIAMYISLPAVVNGAKDLFGSAYLQLLPEYLALQTLVYFVILVLGVIASAVSIVGSVRQIFKKNFRLALFGSVLNTVWLGLWIAMSYVFPSTSWFQGTGVLGYVVAIFLIAPAIVTVYLTKNSETEFA